MLTIARMLGTLAGGVEGKTFQAKGRRRENPCRGPGAALGTQGCSVLLGIRNGDRLERYRSAGMWQVF